MALLGSPTQPVKTYRMIVECEIPQPQLFGLWASYNILGGLLCL